MSVHSISGKEQYVRKLGGIDLMSRWRILRTHNQAVASNEWRPRTKDGLTIVELLVVIAVLSILAILLLMGMPRMREASRRQSCQSNVRQIMLALKMYAGESSGNFYPPMMRYTSVDWSQEQGEFYVGPCALPNPPSVGGQIQNTFDWKLVYPEYLPDVMLNLCPSDHDRALLLKSGRWHTDSNEDGHGDPTAPIDPCAITAESYGYLPWAVRVGSSVSAETMLAEADYIAGLVEVFDRRLNEGPKVFEEDLPGDLSGAPIFRFREGVERLLITDINNPDGESQSELPVFFDLVSIEAFRFNHVPGGANVVFLDGHVEFIKYPGRFPVSPEFALVAGIFGAS